MQIEGEWIVCLRNAPRRGGRGPPPHAVGSQQTSPRTGGLAEYLALALKEMRKRSRPTEPILAGSSVREPPLGKCQDRFWHFSDVTGRTDDVGSSGKSRHCSCRAEVRS